MSSRLPVRNPSRCRWVVVEPVRIRCPMRSQECDAMQCKLKTVPFLPQKEIPHGSLDGKASCAILWVESSCEAAPLPAASKHVPAVPVVQTA